MKYKELTAEYSRVILETFCDSVHPRSGLGSMRFTLVHECWVTGATWMKLKRPSIMLEGSEGLKVHAFHGMLRL
jgi:hypothetical protein